MSVCLIGLGANLGNRRETLQKAVHQLATRCGGRLIGVSRWIETRPVGGPVDQPAYLNGAATIETSLAPNELLELLHQIEEELGRHRDRRWAAREIDLDLLLYENHVEQSGSLVVPHPRMAWRRFVLEPAVEIAPSMVHPTIGWTIQRLFDHLNTTPPYIALAGSSDQVRTEFARRVAKQCGAEVLSRHQRPSLAGRLGDSGGDEWLGGLECLRQQARLLAIGSPRWRQPKRSVVSDFWFDELRAWAFERLAEGEIDTFFHLWCRKSLRVVRPRLVVWLAGQEDGRLASQLRRQGVGPVLGVAEPQTDEAIEEVVAAIRAME